MRTLARGAVDHLPPPFRVAVRQRTLLHQLTKRDIEVRYRGSRLGLFWSVINPLFMLGVYTFVFGVVFKSRWPGQTHTGILDYALIIFSGLVVITAFTETSVRATTAILGVPNYVKKVVFPLELIPISIVGGSLFHLAMSGSVLLIGIFVFWGLPSWTAITLPILLAPVALLALAFAWFFASLGVFVRDLTYVVQLAMQILVFLTPVLYPDDLIPSGLRPVLLTLNPFAHAVNDVRAVLLWGRPVNWPITLAWVAVAALLAVAGGAWFNRTKSAFADVI